MRTIQLVWLKLMEVLFKTDKTKHISPKFFHTCELIKNKNIDVKLIQSRENLANMLTKSLLSLVFKNLIYKVGMR